MPPLSATELANTDKLHGIDHRVCVLVHGATVPLARALSGHRSPDRVAGRNRSIIPLKT